jgi:hypothetical protein
MRFFVKSSLCLLYLLLLATSAIAPGQTSSRRRTDPQYEQRRGGVYEPFEERIAREQAKARNKERQDEMKKDMEKLYQLATELKTAVDKTDENTLSVEVIRKTEDVEKLAKRIREKMKADYMMPGPAAGLRF